MTRGERNRHVTHPTQADCEPGCQGCFWALTCDGPPDLCAVCGLAVERTGFIPDDEPVCTCRGAPWVAT